MSQLTDVREHLVHQAATAGVIQAGHREGWKQAFDRNPAAATKRLTGALASGKSAGLPAGVQASSARFRHQSAGRPTRIAASQAPVPTARTAATAERDQAIDQAVADGKFSEERRGLYEALWEHNTELARSSIAALAPGLTSVGDKSTPTVHGRPVLVTADSAPLSDAESSLSPRERERGC